MRLADIRPELILGFLDHLEHERKNAVRSLNLRLTALRAFLKFAARRDVASLHDIERARAVPTKRFKRPMLGFLSRAEMIAGLGQPGKTWSSQRDHLLLAMLYNTGARVSEIIGVRVVDVVLDVGACVHLHGKGRKLRFIPLWACPRAAGIASDLGIASLSGTANCTKIDPNSICHRLHLAQGHKPCHLL